jgi:ATP-binding cassette subfamily B protein
LVEFIEGMKDIKLYNSQNRKRWEWEKIQVKILNINLKSLSIEQFQSIGSLFINQTKNVLITYFSAKMVIEGDFTLGMMLSIQFMVGQLEGPINQYLEVTRSWQDAKLSISRMNEIQSKENEDNAKQKPLEKNVRHNILFNNVSFQ